MEARSGPKKSGTAQRGALVIYVNAAEVGAPRARNNSVFRGCDVTRTQYTLERCRARAFGGLFIWQSCPRAACLRLHADSAIRERLETRIRALSLFVLFSIPSPNANAPLYYEQ